jgi:hypothetical protein
MTVLSAAGCGDDSNPPTAGDDLPITWDFDAGLDGWGTGAAAAAGHGGAVTATAGTVVLRGWGAPGEPDAWITQSLTLPAAAYTIRVRAISDCAEAEAENDTYMRILLTASGSTTVLLDWRTIDEDTYQSESADLDAFAGQMVTLRIEMDDEGGQEDDLASGEMLCIDQIQITGD